jgi:hypothetical protein
MQAVLVALALLLLVQLWLRQLLRAAGGRRG